MKRAWFLPLLMIVLIAAFRVLGSSFPEQLANFQPISALCFAAGAILIGRGSSILVPAIAWLISYPLASIMQGYSPLENPEGAVVAIVGLALTSLIGIWFREVKNPVGLLFGGLLAAVAFHFVTNSLHWIVDVRYAKTMEGYSQAIWFGLPTDALPSWAFFRNLAYANVLFLGMILAFRPLWAETPSKSLQSAAI